MRTVDAVVYMNPSLCADVCLEYKCRSWKCAAGARANGCDEVVSGCELCAVVMFFSPQYSVSVSLWEWCSSAVLTLVIASLAEAWCWSGVVAWTHRNFHFANRQHATGCDKRWEVWNHLVEGIKLLMMKIETWMWVTTIRLWGLDIYFLKNNCTADNNRVFDALISIHAIISKLSENNAALLLTVIIWDWAQLSDALCL